VKKSPLWEISVITSAEAEEAVVELLARIFQTAAAIYKNEETGITKVSIYGTPASGTAWSEVAGAPASSTADSILPQKQTYANVAAGLKTIHANGLNIGVGKIEVRKLKQEDWAESWKKHFKPIAIGKKLLIKPSWIKRKPLKNQAVVILDPGLSFGTGNHPTTTFCLSELVKNRRRGTAQSFWDVGTGTGILAIAAAKLGYTPVRAIDFDPESVRISRENARNNNVLEKVSITRADITKLPLKSAKKFDLICANLISNLLIAERSRIANRLRSGGVLVLAGILAKEFFAVQRAYEEFGFRLVRSKTEGEWRSGAFRFS
jgi:ribosomal protein L11 methyltransferase